MSINPTPQNIMEVFSSNNPYYIDFYQRDYQWKQDQMERLLDDLFYRFSLEYRPTIDPTQENVSKFDWYYLNAYVTNDHGGHTFIVDGQQRLTSLTLILIKLYHLAQVYNPDRIDLVKEQIMGSSLQGKTFWMGQNGRKGVLEDLFNNQSKKDELDDDNLSFQNLYNNYKTASDKLDFFLDSSHKFEAFLIYFLTRVMLVRIHIQESKDVPMVFEVINDRGVSLKPYEVLKGKLLGQIDKQEIDPYNELWQEHVHKLQKIDESQVDAFFRFYFRSKHVETRAEYSEFDGDYHKAIYENKWNKKIQLKANPIRVKEFVKRDINYYATLYRKIVNDSKSEQAQYSSHLHFNGLNEQDRQFLLVLSACEIDDTTEIPKVKKIARYFDQHFTLLQLTGAYDSNKFTDSIVTLNKNLREKSLQEISEIYEQQILDDISAGLGVEVTDPFDWKYYKDASKRNMGNRFLRYFFARIDHFIATHLPSLTAESYHDLVRKRGYVYGYDIEHILANNEENLERFASDEDIFHYERNRLGALVLLQARDNKASSNETYLKKRKIYSRTLLWNRTLHPDFYHKNKDFTDFANRYSLDFHPIDVYDMDAIDHRQKLLHDLIKIIWKPE